MMVEWFQIPILADEGRTDSLPLRAQGGGETPAVFHPPPPPPESPPSSVHPQPCFQNSCLGPLFWLRHIKLECLKMDGIYSSCRVSNGHDSTTEEISGTNLGWNKIPWNVRVWWDLCLALPVSNVLLSFKPTFASAVLHLKPVGHFLDRLSVKRWNLTPFLWNMVWA